MHVDFSCFFGLKMILKCCMFPLFLVPLHRLCILFSEDQPEEKRVNRTKLRISSGRVWFGTVVLFAEKELTGRNKVRPDENANFVRLNNFLSGWFFLPRGFRPDEIRSDRTKFAGMKSGPVACFCREHFNRMSLRVTGRDFTFRPVSLHLVRLQCYFS